ncbi:MAG: TolC family protein [Tannerellaceae bacterium]|jgi:outer membrane protein TolC|nr:TolC family protein [Tannerellaceae bacterium]
MKTIILLITGVAFLLYSNPVKAQERPQRYSLGQCLDFAVNNSYPAYRAALDMEEAVHQKQEVRSGILPQINGSGSFDNNVILGKTMLPGEIIGEPGVQIPVEMGTKNTLDFTASLEQVLFDPSLFTGIKIAKNNYELQRLRSIMTKEEIIFDVSYAFYDILNSMQELDNIRYMIEKQDSLHILMKERVQQNITREVDLNRIKVNLINLRIRGEHIKNTIAQQKRYLQILLGMPVEERLELDDSEMKNIVAPTLHSCSPPQDRIELTILEKQKDILDLQIKQERMRYLPTLSAVASAGYQFQSDKLNLSKEPWFNSVMVGVRLTVPLFDGFSKYSQVKQRQIQRQRLEWDMQETQQNIAASYRNAQEQLTVTYESVQAQKENLQLAEKVYAQSMMLYKEGLAGMTDLLETETSLREAKITYAAELIRFRKTEVDMLKANGILENLLNNK